MMELHRIAARALFAFVFLLLLLRLTGRRTVVQASTQSFIAALILGDLVDDLLWGDVSPGRFAVAAGTIGGLELVLSTWTSRSARIRALLEQGRTILMRHGRPLHAALRRERIHLRQFEDLLRRQGIEPQRWSEVRTAWLNPNGEIGALEETWARPLQKQDKPRHQSKPTP